jgi:YbbR domain-containing protein
MAWHPFRNVGWKLLATVLGTLLWVTVSGELAIERAVDDRPVAMKNAAAGVQAVVAPVRVAVTVRGSRAQLGSLDESQISAWVDLAGLGAGMYRLPVRVERPGSVQVSKVTPASVEVRIR